MSSPLAVSGLASGLDTESIISSLMAIERQPRTLMTYKQAASQAQEDDLNALKTKLTALSLAKSALSSVTLWTPTQTVDTTDATKVTARRTGGAGPGGYQLDVANLASAEQRTFTLGDTSAASTLTLTASGQATGVSVPIAAGATVDDVVSAINANSSAPVYAVNVDGKLVLSSKQTGAANGFSVAGDTQLVAGTVKAGVDATYSVDGITKTSATNVVANGIPGVELTLRAPTASAITVNVGAPAPDKDQTIAAVKAFVSAYNDVVDTVRAELKDKRVPNPSSAADARKGDLFGDTMLSGMLDSMRQTVSTVSVGGLTMADIGVSTGQSTGAAATADMIDGKLTADDAALSQALDSDPAAVQKLLGGMPDTQGFAQAFGAVLDPIQQAGGLLDARIDAANDAVKLFQSQMDDMDQRLTLREDYLRKQFSSLELALQHSQAQSSDLASRLASLPGA